MSGRAIPFEHSCGHTVRRWFSHPQASERRVESIKYIAEYPCPGCSLAELTKFIEEELKDEDSN